MIEDCRHYRVTSHHSDDSFRTRARASASRSPSFFRFGLATVLWLKACFGLGLSWWIDRQHLEERLAKLEAQFNPSTTNGWSVQDCLGRPDETTGTGAQVGMKNWWRFVAVSTHCRASRRRSLTLDTWTTCRLSKLRIGYSFLWKPARNDFSLDERCWLIA